MRRNKTLLKLLSGCVALSLVLAYTVSAQTPGGSRFELGLRGGLAMGSIAGEHDYLWDKSRRGFLGGAFARYAVADLISFEMNVGYVMKGGKTDMPATDYTESTDPTEIDRYVEATLISDRFEVVPALVFTLPVRGKIRPSLLGGVSIAFAGSSQIEVEGFEPSDISEYTKSTCVGYVVGAELAYQRKSTRVFIDFRYSRDTGDFFEPEFQEWINKVVSIGVGVGFKI